MQSAGKLLLCGALLLLCLAAAGASDSEVQVPSPEQDADQKPADSPRAETASREGADREDKSAAAPPAASPEAATEATAAVVDTELLMMGVGAIATLGAMAGGWFLMNQGGPKKRKFKGDAIFLVGACDSGKTAVMMQLRDGKTEEKIHPTHSSMQFNESTFALADMDGKPVRIIDCPGHSRLRPQLFDMIEDCAAVVFVIDSCTFASKGLHPCLIETLSVCLNYITSWLTSIPLAYLCSTRNRLIRARSSDVGEDAQGGSQCLSFLFLPLPLIPSRRPPPHERCVTVNCLGAELHEYAHPVQQNGCAPRRTGGNLPKDHGEKALGGAS